MSGIDTTGNAHHRGSAVRARRLDDVWGPVGRRSRMVVAGFVLLLISVGIALLDMAVNPYPATVHRPDRATVDQSGEATRVAGKYGGAGFVTNISSQAILGRAVLY